jgi:ribosomal protein S27E
MAFTDVKCEKCGRVIGQRSGGLFYQFRMKFQFDKSGKISCPFVGCNHEQVFRVNQNQNYRISIDKKLCIT